MSIRVLSFDFDGCLFNINYIMARDNKDVIKYNEVLLKTISNDHHLYSKTITLVGSNRQSKTIDLCNSPHKGSCFPAIKTISTHLKAELDSFLLADIHGDLPDGTSFDRAIDQTYMGPHTDWWFDEHKVTILYAQMHRIATANPGEEIEFDFYDDRSDILLTLAEFYKAHPSLIPANVTLCLHQYAGQAPQHIHSIQGTGMIDGNYKETVKEMWAIARKGAKIPDDANPAIKSIRTDRYVTETTILTQRIELQKIDDAPPVLEVEVEVEVEVEILDTKLVVVESSAIEFTNQVESPYKNDTALQNPDSSDDREENVAITGKFLFFRTGSVQKVNDQQTTTDKIAPTV